MKKYFTFFLLILLFSCGGKKYKNPHILLVTRLGDIEIEMFPDKAPITVAAFMKNMDAGIYNGGAFYRVVKSDQLPTDYNTGIIQGGAWKNNAEPGNNLPGIPHENTLLTGLSHTNGTLSMARKDTGSAKTEFFICIGDQSTYDFGRRGNPDGQGYAAFARVFKGMDIVKKIQNQSSRGDRFDQVIVIRKIKKL